MKNNNVFRDLYHNYSIFPLLESKRAYLESYDGYEEADCMLGYGMVSEGVLHILILALAKKEENGYDYFAVKEEQLAAISILELKDLPYALNPVIDEDYEYWIDEIHEVDWDGKQLFYDDEELDEFRETDYAGNVRVELFKVGFEKETATVEWQDVIGGFIHIGILATEPKQDLGVHEGDIVSFVKEVEDDRVSLKAYLDYVIERPEGELEDGSCLRNAAALFYALPNHENFSNAIRTLAVSNVWIPCTVDTESYSKEAINKAIASLNDGDGDIVNGGYVLDGVQFDRVDAENEFGEYAVAMFTNQQDAIDYGEYLAIHMSAAAAIVSAMRTHEAYAGLVVDPGLKGMLYLERDYWNWVLKQSGLIPEEAEETNLS